MSRFTLVCIAYRGSVVSQQSPCLWMIGHGSDDLLERGHRFCAPLQCRQG